MVRIADTALIAPITCNQIKSNHLQVLMIFASNQLICISDIYLLTDKYKRHSRAICYQWWCQWWWWWWYRCWNVCWSLWYHPYHVVHPDHLTTWPPRLPRPFPIPVLESCDGRRKTHSLKPSEYVGEAVLPIYIAYWKSYMQTLERQLNFVVLFVYK